MRLPIYPAKGYSVTMPVQRRVAGAPGLADRRRVQAGVLALPRGDRLRIAGTAELNGYDRDLNRVRCEAHRAARARSSSPAPATRRSAQFWTGLRPATPSNVPLIGKTQLPNLFLNTGHGTLGWTHACGSGKSIARHRERAEAGSGFRVHRAARRGSVAGGEDGQHAGVAVQVVAGDLAGGEEADQRHVAEGMPHDLQLGAGRAEMRAAAARSS